MCRRDQIFRFGLPLILVALKQCLYKAKEEKLW